jgi:ATP-dependent helicase/nuclease subunit A
MSEYTREQHRAIFTHDRNLIVVAGAGSGKTRVLVDRFVSLLDVNRDWALSSLVAITFTEKAAREMRDRVRRTIEARTRQTANTPDGLRWRDHLNALDGARIGTIHSLCAVLLRANAAKLRIDPHFSVLDDADAAVLRDDAVETALSALANANDPAIQLLLQYKVDDVRRTVRGWLGRSAVWHETAQDYLSRWREQWEKIAQGIILRFFNDAEVQGIVAWRPSVLPQGDKFAGYLQAMWTLWDSIPQCSTAAEVVTLLKTFADGINMQGGSKKIWGDDLETVRAVLNEIRARIDTVVKACGDPIGEDDERAAELLVLWRTAVQKAQEEYKALKLARRALDFDDLEQMTWTLLKDFPEVAERYRNAEFRHIMVDEFQDTNITQREIIRALTGFDRAGSLFVVGDPKQSIYLFRGADVSVFQQVRTEITRLGGAEIPLDTSFRTHNRLVGVTNAIFNRLLNDRPDREDYEVEPGPMTHNRESEYSPCMEILIADAGDKNDKIKDKSSEQTSDKTSERNRARKSVTVDDLRRMEATMIATRIREMHGTFRVWDRATNSQRPMDYGDVAVLFRSSTNIGIVEETFKPAGIPYVTFSGKGYYDLPEVVDLQNLLKAIYNPADALSLAAALRSPLYALSDETLFALCQQKDENGAYLSLWQALQAPDHVPAPPQSVDFARDTLMRLHSMAGRITIAELLSCALEETAYLATLNGLPDGARKSENVEKFLEIARSSGHIGLGAFTAYIQELRQREIREGEAVIEAGNAVRLMTIHASKGLEFPVVCLYDCAWERNSSQTAILISDPVIGAACKIPGEDGKATPIPSYGLAAASAKRRESAESVRLLYVGLTRAQDYVIATGNSEGKPTSWIVQLEQTCKDLPDVRIERITQVPEIVSGTDDSSSGWDLLTDAPVDGVVAKVPPLLAPVQPDQRAFTRVLTASSLQMLGESQVSGDTSRLRRYLTHSAPAAIHEVSNPDNRDRVPPRIVGSMVHRALQWGWFPETVPNLKEMLDSLAWENGIADPVAIQQAVDEAYRLLERTQHSAIIRASMDAEQCRRELAFTHCIGDRTIAGVIDVLFYTPRGREHGTWHLVDYKTGYVRTDEGTLQDALNEHARRYYAQVGVYAAAVEAITGQYPDVHIHYVRHVRTVHVPHDDLRAVLDKLDSDLTTVIEGM